MDGLIPGGLTDCIWIIGGISGSWVLKCANEEAGERILFHKNYVFQIESYRNIIVAAADIDIFTKLLYHYQQWIHEDLGELWCYKAKVFQADFFQLIKLLTPFRKFCYWCFTSSSCFNCLWQYK